MADTLSENLRPV